MDIREYLHKKGYNWKEVSRPKGIQAIMPCPSCHDKDSFAISLSDGAFSCLRQNHCGISGSFFDFQKMHGDEYTPLPKDNFIKQKKEYKKPQVKPKPVNQAGYDFFKNRLITQETIKKFKIGMTEKEVMFPYFKNGELVNIKYRNIAEKKFRKEADCMSTLFNQDNVQGLILIICEGEMDCMALSEYGFEAVSIPSGVNDLTWIENDWDFLERFQTIIIIMDNDKAGQESVETIVNRLGRWRCHNALLPYKDPNECLLNNVSREEMFELIYCAHGYDLPELRVCSNYIDEIIEYQNNPQKLYGIDTGIQELTEIIKGWRLEEVSIWTGSNGSGKSTLLNQEILSLLRQGKIICIGSFEMPPRKYLRWLIMQYFQRYEFTAEEIKEVLTKYSSQLYIINIVGEIRQNNLISIMEFAYRKYGVEYFFIDSLMRISFNEKYELKEQKHFIAALKEFCSKYRSHIHVVAHPRKGSSDEDVPGKTDISGTADITNLADNVFSFYRFTEEAKEKARETGKGIPDNILFVKKNREHGDLGKINLFFNSRCKRYYTENAETDFNKLEGIK